MSEDDDEAELLKSFKMMLGKPTSKNYCPRVKLRKTFLMILIASVVVILFYCWKQSDEISETTRYIKARLKSPVYCGVPALTSNPLLFDSRDSKVQNSKTRSPGKVLVVPKSTYSKAHKTVTELLAAHRIGYKSSVAGKNLPDLIKLTRNLGKYGIIVFEDYRSYLDMDPWNRGILDKYCQNYKVGIIAFVPAEEKPFVNVQFADKSGKIQDLPTVNTRVNISKLEITSSAKILRLTKSGTSNHLSPGTWVTLSFSNDSNYEAITAGYFNSSANEPTVILDLGKQDSIPKVLFGSGLAKHWLYKLLFLDGLQYVSNGLINFPHRRYILVDIDDVFVGSNRFDPDDVRALIESQNTISTLIPGFRYNLGFSGKTFKTGTQSNIEADELLMENRHKFWWFPHMWSHLQPHMFTNISKVRL